MFVYENPYSETQKVQVQAMDIWGIDNKIWENPTLTDIKNIECDRYLYYNTQDFVDEFIKYIKNNEDWLSDVIITCVKNVMTNNIANWHFNLSVIFKIIKDECYRLFEDETYFRGPKHSDKQKRLYKGLHNIRYWLLRTTNSLKTIDEKLYNETKNISSVLNGNIYYDIHLINKVVNIITESIENEKRYVNIIDQSFIKHITEYLRNELTTEKSSLYGPYCKIRDFIISLSCVDYSKTSFFIYRRALEKINILFLWHYYKSIGLSTCSAFIPLSWFDVLPVTGYIEYFYIRDNKEVIVHKYKEYSNNRLRIGDIVMICYYKLV
jgi:hypothetical protein